ncbi:MAG: hypothetical protein HZB50_19215 [Chloroflexi bacterium]|nr:hypothetical protein [Chloroflexota bacterium]
MKAIRSITVFSGLVILVYAFGFIFHSPFSTNLWPWPDGQLSYLFVGSILAAVSIAALWIGWTGEFAALPAGSLNIFVIAITSAYFMFQFGAREHENKYSLYGIIYFLMAVISIAAFLWSRRLDLGDSRPMPGLVRVSFGIFIVSLFLSGGALVMNLPVFPWKLDPKSSVIFGCIFLGDAFYFLYGLFYPRWHHALGQLLSFLVYDLVLIIPFLMLFKTVKPEYWFNLVGYVSVLIYSGAIAVYYLFINSETRFKL